MAHAEEKIVEVLVEKIKQNPHQPREIFRNKEISDLANSIKMHGQIQPILLKKVSGGFWELIAGEKRVRAHKLLEMKTIKAIVRNNVSPETQEEIAIVENNHRSDLTIIEKARAYKRAVDRRGGNVKLLADRISVDPVVINSTIELLGLPDEVQQMLNNGTLSIYQAKVLLEIPRDKQVQIAYRAAELKLSPSQIKGQMQNIIAPKRISREKFSRRNGKVTVEKVTAALIETHTLLLEYDFSQVFGVKRKHMANQIRLLAKTLGKRYKILKGTKKGADQ